MNTKKSYKDSLTKEDKQFLKVVNKFLGKKEFKKLLLECKVIYNNEDLTNIMAKRAVNIYINNHCKKIKPNFFYKDYI